MSAAELIHGPLHLMILKTLSWEPLHGYAIARAIRTLTDDVLRVEEGSLYPALHRLKQRGLVEASWGVSENNRRAKYYRLTARGRRHLASESTNWLRYADAVGNVLKAQRTPG